ncbi:MAG: hypothetical protein M3Z06_05990 [Actinomycetota bacterium]|nr:hypothetical protein [Actinomycetota bacterium]
MPAAAFFFLTAVVAAELAGVLGPLGFEAVSNTRMRYPTSEARSLYAWPVAPLMVEHFVTARLQCFHVARCPGDDGGARRLGVGGAGAIGVGGRDLHQQRVADSAAVRVYVLDVAPLALQDPWLSQSNHW